jgi:predicted SAM-dependent methyltransferase
MSGWNWERPEELSGRMDELLLDLARCEKLEPVDAAVPYTRQALRGLGVTGIEFAAWKTQHASGIGTDLVSLRAADGTASEPRRIYRVDGERHFVELDICRPLPFEAGSLDWAYAEHLVEHVSLGAAIEWLAEVRRILAPGGLLRLTTPDLARYVRGYLGDDGFFARHRGRLRAARLGPPMPDRRAFMFNQMFYLYGHRWIYDLEELRYALGAAGFDPEAVRRCAFRDGARPDVADLDRVLRNDETMYVEVLA